MSRRDAAMQQALEVLKDSARWCRLYYGSREVGSAIHALEAALAEPQPQPQPEPVACSETFSCRCPKHYSTEPEPVADEVKAQALDALNRMQSIMIMSDGRHPRDVLRAFIQLASTPPQRQPLSDEQINALELPESGKGTVRDLVRIVERAHGIGGAT